MSSKSFYKDKMLLYEHIVYKIYLVTNYFFLRVPCTVFCPNVIKTRAPKLN
jgi:hypothetical protein